MTTLVLLAAGRGSRLGNRTSDLPKCLNTYKGRALIEYILDLHSQFLNQITQVVVVTGYRGELLKKYGYITLENTEWARSGPFRSLSVAESYLSADDCIISYTDIVYGPEFFESCLASQADIFVPSNANFLNSWKNREVDILQDLETFTFIDKFLTSIGERAKDLSEIQGQFAGIIKTTPRGWSTLSAIAESQHNQHLDMTGLLKLIIILGGRVECNQVYSEWKEFDLPSDFE